MDANGVETKGEWKNGERIKAMAFRDGLGINLGDDLGFPPPWKSKMTKKNQLFFL